MLNSLRLSLLFALLASSCTAPVSPAVQNSEDLLGDADRALATRSPEGLERASQLYQQVTELVPNEARGWAGLAESLALSGLYGVQLPTQVMPKAGLAAERALELDPENPLTLAVQGLVRYLHNWDWKGAEASFSRALEIDPTRAEALHWSAMMFSATGRHDEALSRIEKAAALVPQSPLFSVKVGTILANAGRLDEAKTSLEESSARFPNFVMALNELGLLGLRVGNEAEAVEFFSRALELDPESDRALAGLAVSWSRLGEENSVKEVSQKLRSLAKKSYVSPAVLAELDLAEDSVSEALEELDRGLQIRDPGLVYLLTRPGLDPLWKEPEFRELVVEIGLRDHEWSRHSTGEPH